jgi:hypothetical protein
MTTWVSPELADLSVIDGKLTNLDKLGELVLEVTQEREFA